jgi:hypothetical protein
VVPALGLDPSPVTLNGYCFSIVGTIIGWVFSGNDATGTFIDRVPTGGTPPYSYSSADPSIAEVDARGRVRSTGNGTTRITVTDGVNSTGSFEVSVSNVRHIIFKTTLGDPQNHIDWIRDQGGSPIVAAHRNDLARFRSKLPSHLADRYWTGDTLIITPPPENAFRTPRLSMHGSPVGPVLETLEWSKDTRYPGVALK